jgi:hypothetical protein
MNGKKLSMSAVFSEALLSLTEEELQRGIHNLQIIADTAFEGGHLQSNLEILFLRNEMIHELEVRAAKKEGGTPARHLCGLLVIPHFAIRSLSATFPEETADTMMTHSEATIRTMWNEGFLQRPWPESQATADWPNEYPFDAHTAYPPALRLLSPLAIVFLDGEEPTDFETSAPPINVWWAAEDKIANDPIGSWVLVWRKYYGEMIHEGWVQSVSEGGENVCTCLQYMTRYRGGTLSPLPLSSA